MLGLLKDGLAQGVSGEHVEVIDAQAFAEEIEVFPGAAGEDGGAHDALVEAADPCGFDLAEGITGGDVPDDVCVLCGFFFGVGDVGIFSAQVAWGIGADKGFDAGGVCKLDGVPGGIDDAHGLDGLACFGSGDKLAPCEAAALWGDAAGEFAIGGGIIQGEVGQIVPQEEGEGIEEAAAGLVMMGGGDLAVWVLGDVAQAAADPAGGGGALLGRTQGEALLAHGELVVCGEI